MSSRKLMILGGGETQLPLIETALSMQYDVVICGNRNRINRVQVSEKLKSYIVDYRDKEKVLDIARREKIDGIISNSEFAMRTVAYVAEQMELPGTSLESVCRVNEKAAFRKLQHDIGAFAPEFALTSSFEEALDRVGNLAFPVVLKPNYSSGSRGTTVIEDYYMLLKAADIWQMCSDISLDNNVCIEEYVEMEALDGYVEQDIFVMGDRIIWDGIDTCMRSTELKK